MLDAVNLHLAHLLFCLFGVPSIPGALITLFLSVFLCLICLSIYAKFIYTVFQYIHGLAARGVHYLHRPGPTLQDVGFYLLPVRFIFTFIIFIT